jgi:hypothetical protein
MDGLFGFDLFKCSSNILHTPKKKMHSFPKLPDITEVEHLLLNGLK